MRVLTSAKVQMCVYVCVCLCVCVHAFDSVCVWVTSVVLPSLGRGSGWSSGQPPHTFTHSHTHTHTHGHIICATQAACWKMFGSHSHSHTHYTPTEKATLCNLITITHTQTHTIHGCFSFLHKLYLHDHSLSHTHTHCYTFFIAVWKATAS